MSHRSSSSRIHDRAAKRQPTRLPFHPQKRSRRAPAPLELTTSLPDVLALAASPLPNGALLPRPTPTPPPPTSPPPTPPPPPPPSKRFVEMVGLAWPHEVVQEARRKNPSRRRTHSP
ncbi:hypothetical protein ACLKA6_001660 [Drosophila palustris]